jgi:5S rRNA maturation endonuclease (ribonuclease M5)
MLTESPIDALSLATLEKETRREVNDGLIYLSVDGSGAIPVEALRQVLEQGGQVVVAFDADQAGEIMAWRIAQELPGVRRMKPSYGKDWNERLIYDERYKFSTATRAR